MIDDIVEQVRKIREEHAAKFQYDLTAIYEDIKEQERLGGRELTVLPAKKPMRLSEKTG